MIGSARPAKEIRRRLESRMDGRNEQPRTFAKMFVHLMDLSRGAQQMSERPEGTLFAGDVDFGRAQATIFGTPGERRFNPL